MAVIWIDDSTQTRPTAFDEYWRARDEAAKEAHRLADEYQSGDWRKVFENFDESGRRIRPDREYGARDEAEELRPFTSFPCPKCGGDLQSTTKEIRCSACGYRYGGQQ